MLMPTALFLVDTNVISEFVSKKPNAKVMQWLQGVSAVAFSVVSIEEAYFGLTWQPQPQKLALLEGIILQAQTVYPVTAAIARRAGALRGQLQRGGKSRSQAEMLIAATALEHQLTLVTRNTKDFAGCGIDLVNPFA